MPSPDRSRKILLTLLAVAFIWLALGAVFSAQNSGSQLTTGELTEAATEGQIESMLYSPRMGSVVGQMLPAPAEDGKDAGLPVTFSGYVAGDEGWDALVTAARKGNPEVKWDAAPAEASGLLSFIGSLIPVLLLVGLMFYLLRSMGGKGGIGGIGNFAKSKAKRAGRDAPRVTFNDVAGCDEAVEELKEVKDFLANPSKFKALGAKIPTGVLLVGPPGTGKTLLARAVAGEAGVPFFTVSGSDFVEMFVGVGSARMRSMFEEAKAAAPAIVFVDEIDAVGRQRGAGVGGGNDEREQTLNSLLVEMDGFHGNSDVIVMAATNRPDVLDPALLRPGRFDRQIVVDRPDLVGREAILAIHAKGKPWTDGVDLHAIARSTAGMVGADLANMVNEAALLAARREQKAIGQKDLHDAMERVLAGAERRTRVLNDRERRIVAYHEAGHAIVGHEMEGSDPIHKVTIIPRGRALGYTMALPEEDTFLETRSELMSDLAMLLGGRTAEELTCGDITTGAGSDIERASALARAMVTRYGMSRLGPLTFGQPRTDVFLGRDMGNAPDYGEGVATAIDGEVTALIEEAHSLAREVLERRRPTLDLMAEVLLDRETVEGEALAALLGDTWEAYTAKTASETPSVVGGP